MLGPRDHGVVSPPHQESLGHLSSHVWKKAVGKRTRSRDSTENSLIEEIGTQTILEEQHARIEICRFERSQLMIGRATVSSRNESEGSQNVTARAGSAASAPSQPGSVGSAHPDRSRSSKRCRRERERGTGRRR